MKDGQVRKIIFWLDRDEQFINVINEIEMEGVKKHKRDQNSTCRKFRRVASNGKEYNTKFYNLEAVIAVGFRANSDRAIQFRQWATTVLKDLNARGNGFTE